MLWSVKTKTEPTLASNTTLEYLTTLCDDKDMPLYIARIYDTPKTPDTYRVLVDRLWPRGISKAQAGIDLWAKEVAPSTDLRTWFGHDPKRFAEFSERYMHELDTNAALPEFIRTIRDHANVTLLYAAKDPRINHAVVL